MNPGQCRLRQDLLRARACPAPQCYRPMDRIAAIEKGLFIISILRAAQLARNTPECACRRTRSVCYRTQDRPAIAPRRNPAGNGLSVVRSVRHQT